MKNRFIKYPYSALSANNPDYDQYVIFKNICSTSKKSGFIEKGEIQRIAKESGVHINKLYKQLSKFKSIGWIVKSENGHRLLSINTINNNLNLKSKTKGFTYYPFFKIASTQINNLEEHKMYYLINEKANQFNHVVEANKIADYNRSLKFKVNEYNKKPMIHSFKISLAKIKEKGNYKYNSTVDKIINNAIDLGLVERKKNGFNTTTNKFKCNEYVLNHFHWSDFLTVKELPKMQVLTKPKTVKRVKPRKELNAIEIKFRSFIDLYLVELVNNKIIDSKYLNRKVSRLSFNKILTKVIKNEVFRSLLYGFIQPNEIQVIKSYIENGMFTSKKFEYLPKVFTDKEYGIEFKFVLGNSKTVEKDITDALDIIAGKKVYQPVVETETIYLTNLIQIAKEKNLEYNKSSIQLEHDTFYFDIINSITTNICY